MDRPARLRCTRRASSSTLRWRPTDPSPWPVSATSCVVLFGVSRRTRTPARAGPSSAASASGAGAGPTWASTPEHGYITAYRCGSSHETQPRCGVTGTNSNCAPAISSGGGVGAVVFRGPPPPPPPPPPLSPPPPAPPPPPPRAAAPAAPARRRGRGDDPRLDAPPPRPAGQHRLRPHPFQQVRGAFRQVGPVQAGGQRAAQGHRQVRAGGLRRSVAQPRQLLAQR